MKKKLYDNLKEIFETSVNETNNFISLAKVNSRDYTPRIEVKFYQELEERVDDFIKLPYVRDYIKEHKQNKKREVLVKDLCDLILENPDLDNNQKMTLSVRSCIALMTEAVTSACEEGFQDVVERFDNEDGSSYVEVTFMPPIRSAGGTIAALAVLVTDYCRIKLNYGVFKPSNEEVERFVSEVMRYCRLFPRQRNPTSIELDRLIKACPVFINAPGSEEEEVEVYKNLPRCKTPRVRGAVALVVTEGLLLKWRKLLKFAPLFNLDYSWLSEIIEMTKPTPEEKEESASAEPDYLKKAIMGRPIYSEPNRPGGFRLRVGRSRFSGFNAIGINPSVCKLLKFMNVGSQLKMEYPRKSGGISLCESLEPPVVKLKDGQVLPYTLENYERIDSKVEKILDLGELCVSYTDFLTNNYPLPMLDHCDEIWKLECEDKQINWSQSFLNEQEMIDFVIKNDLIIHPRYLANISAWNGGEYSRLRNHFLKYRFKNMSLIKPLLDKAAFLMSLKEGALILDYPLVFEKLMVPRLNLKYDPAECFIEFINKHGDLRIRKKGSNLIGCRAGRAESVVASGLKPKSNWLFEFSFKNNHFNHLLQAKEKIVKKSATFRCKECYMITHMSRHCEKPCERVYHRADTNEFLSKIEVPQLSEKEFERNKSFFEFNLRDDFLKESKKYLIDNLKFVNNVKGIVFDEPILKGLIRAKYGVSVYRDATVCIEASNLLLTHFKPFEVGVSVEKLKELGYLEDILGKPLERDDQMLELFDHDIVLPLHFASYFLKISNYLDELLIEYYKNKPFFNAESKEDLIGHLIGIIAPHTCVLVTGRLIGFSLCNGVYTHPVFKAANRRDFDGDGDRVGLYLDFILNYSNSYLRQSNAAKMNVPYFVLTRLNYAEIDKDAHDFEIVWSYPREIYTGEDRQKSCATIKDFFKNPDLEIGYTLESSFMSLGNLKNCYKDLDSMKTKINLQLDLMGKLASVDLKRMINKVIEGHLLADLRGNIRTYLAQGFKCSKCSEPHRAMPLIGCCFSCGSELKNKVYPNSVKKYWWLLENLSEKVGLDPYLERTYEIVKIELEELFHDRKKNILTNFLTEEE